LRLLAKYQEKSSPPAKALIPFIGTEDQYIVGVAIFLTDILQYNREINLPA
jgi:hypothetical protein